MTEFPRIRTVGLSGLLVQFADAMSEPANRAALAFRARAEAENWPGVLETSTSLVSTYFELDLSVLKPETLSEMLRDLLAETDWYAAPLPSGRTLWHVPTVYGGDEGPQLVEAAEAAGVSPEQAVADLSQARVRVLTIGFAPGQPYMGELPPHWNIPRQQGLTQSVPAGALVVAIRQLIVFTNDTPTGWRHIGQTAFRLFRPDAECPFALSPGDELVFPQISAAELGRIRATADASGGATREALT